MRRKLSLAFKNYNLARADAIHHGDTKKIAALNKVLGNLVKAAHRYSNLRRGIQGNPGEFRGILGNPGEFREKNICAILGVEGKAHEK